MRHDLRPGTLKNILEKHGRDQASHNRCECEVCHVTLSVKGEKAYGNCRNQPEYGHSAQSGDIASRFLESRRTTRRKIAGPAHGEKYTAVEAVSFAFPDFTGEFRKRERPGGYGEEQYKNAKFMTAQPTERLKQYIPV
jgi:hypothetical protein